MHSRVLCEAPCYLVLERCSINEVYYISQPYYLMFRLFYINIRFLSPLFHTPTLQFSNSGPSGWVGQRAEQSGPCSSDSDPGFVCLWLSLTFGHNDFLAASQPASALTARQRMEGENSEGISRGRGQRSEKLKYACLCACWKKKLL